jgi:DNA-binding MarR family transcriptional regulator
MTMSAGTVSTQEALQLVIAMHRLLRGLRRAADIATPHASQLIVLALLAQYGPLRVGELAGRIPCSQPTATMTVAGLQTSGLVTREADPDDGRASRVLITEQGRLMLRSLAQGEADALTGLLSTMDEDDLRILRAAIPLLSTLADGATTQPERTTALAPGPGWGRKVGRRVLDGAFAVAITYTKAPLRMLGSGARARIPPG